MILHPVINPLNSTTMNCRVKPLAIFTISLFSLFNAHSQIKITPGNKALLNDLRKVIDDYPNQFANIRGELMVQNPQSADYRCNFIMNTAEQCFITRYSDDKRNICSWQACLLTTEEFEDAAKKFRTLFAQLNNTNISGGRLRGAYEIPAEEKNFTSVLFSFDSNDELLKKLKIELVVENELLEWKVKILVYDREQEEIENQAAASQ